MTIKKINLIIIIIFLTLSCSSSVNNDSYPEQATSEMYSLCLKTYRYGYCKCYVDNWKKNISYDKYLILKPQIDSGKIDDPEINELLENLHQQCERLPTSKEGF